ncbi:hypothetical protein Hamer_G024360, partial [Homarus americanus]
FIMPQTVDPSSKATRNGSTSVIGGQETPAAYKRTWPLVVWSVVAAAGQISYTLPAIFSLFLFEMSNTPTSIAQLVSHVSIVSQSCSFLLLLTTSHLLAQVVSRLQDLFNSVSDVKKTFLQNKDNKIQKVAAKIILEPFTTFAGNVMCRRQIFLRFGFSSTSDICNNVLLFCGALDYIEETRHAVATRTEPDHRLLHSTCRALVRQAISGCQGSRDFTNNHVMRHHRPGNITSETQPVFSVGGQCAGAHAGLLWPASPLLPLRHPESISDLYFIIIFPEHMQIDMFLLLANTTTLASYSTAPGCCRRRAACVTWLKEELLYTEDYTVLARGWWLVREMQQTSGPSILGFSPWGTTVSSVCSFVATYLVILLQF